MVRVKRGNVARKRKKKLFKRTKGFRGKLKSVLRMAHQADLKAKKHATRHRKEKKRNFRSLWIIKLSAAAKTAGISYSKLMGAMKKANINLNRKVLSEIAVSDLPTFTRIVEQAKAA